MFSFSGLWMLAKVLPQRNFWPFLGHQGIPHYLKHTSTDMPQISMSLKVGVWQLLLQNQFLVMSTCTVHTFGSHRWHSITSPTLFKIVHHSCYVSVWILGCMVDMHSDRDGCTKVGTAGSGGLVQSSLGAFTFILFSFWWLHLKYCAAWV